MQLCLDRRPLPEGGSIVGCVLCRIICTHGIEYGFRAFELKQVGLCLCFLSNGLILEFLRPKSAVIASHTGTVRKVEPFFILVEVVFKLLLEYALRKWIPHLGLFAIGVIHGPCCFECRPILFFEDVIGVDNKVIKVVRCSQHGDRNIIVVLSGVVQINLLTVIGDGSEFKTDLLYRGFVLLGAQLFSRGRYINQPSDQARLGIGDLYRFVGAHEEEALETVGVGRFELLVDGHQLMRNKAVQARIVLDF